MVKEHLPEKALQDFESKFVIPRNEESPQGKERFLVPRNDKSCPEGLRIRKWPSEPQICSQIPEEPIKHLWPAITDLMATAGFVGDFRLSSLTGGANNRVFRVDVNDSQLLLKVYFQHTNDPRDRLGTEFSFSTFAWQKGIRSQPQPLACDPQNRLGLYEFVDGRQLLPHEVTEGMVQQALDFYRELNRHKQLPEARLLPVASEACFTIADHLRCVDRRLLRLQQGVEERTRIDREAAHFIRHELADSWDNIRHSVHLALGLSPGINELGLALDSEITQEDRCLSPSDFGFHNALLPSDGQLRFIDFEYAGWDDPAKMVCDFFCQPALPVSINYLDMFAEAVVSELSQPEMHLQRIALLLPVHQIKWCCILLNEFLPVGRERRRFAGAISHRRTTSAH